MQIIFQCADHFSQLFKILSLIFISVAVLTGAKVLINLSFEELVGQ